jgi:hypothetical protein
MPHLADNSRLTPRGSRELIGGMQPREWRNREGGE